MQWVSITVALATKCTAYFKCASCNFENVIAFTETTVAKLITLDEGTTLRKYNSVKCRYHIRDDEYIIIQLGGTDLLLES
jgi:hypothetical protein